MNLALLTTYAAHLAAITAAIVENGAESKLASEASKARKDSLATSIRAYAKATDADGVNADEAGTALRLVLTAAEVKPGTVKGYGASFRGYRAMLADGKPAAEVDAANTAKAQEYVASEETKALKVAKDRVKEATKAYKLADWVALADALETAAAPAEATDDEAATDEELAAVAEAA